MATLSEEYVSEFVFFTVVYCSYKQMSINTE